MSLGCIWVKPDTNQSDRSSKTVQMCKINVQYLILQFFVLKGYRIGCIWQCPHLWNPPLQPTHHSKQSYCLWHKSNELSHNHWLCCAGWNGCSGDYHRCGQHPIDLLRLPFNKSYHEIRRSKQKPNKSSSIGRNTFVIKKSVKIALIYRLELVRLPLLVDMEHVPAMLDLSTQTHPWPFGHNLIHYVYVSIIFELERMCIQVCQTLPVFLGFPAKKSKGKGLYRSCIEKK